MADTTSTLLPMSEQPHPDGVRLLPWWPRPAVVDATLVGLILFALVARGLSNEPIDHDVEWVGAITGLVVIPSRRRFPVPALVAALSVTFGVVVFTNEPTMLMFAALFPLFTVSERYEAKWAALAGGITVLVFAVTVLGLIDDRLLGGPALAAIAWPAFVASAGAALRAIKINVATAQEQARRAEADRERDAERRVVEERLRIARDVHDLVGHHLAVINVQSGVAGHLLESDPEAAGTAIEVTRESAAIAVDQLGELLGVLRAEESGGPVSPTPSLDAIDDLISSFGASGLRVEHTTAGSPRPLSESAEVAAYRIVQEALTNAHKHGDGAATVQQVFEARGLTLTVSNRAGSDATGGTGYGLAGMRERVEAVGGTLTVDDADNRFAVTASIPFQDEP